MTLDEDMDQGVNYSSLGESPLLLAESVVVQFAHLISVTDSDVPLETQAAKEIESYLASQTSSLLAEAVEPLRWIHEKRHFQADAQM